MSPRNVGLLSVAVALAAAGPARLLAQTTDTLDVIYGAPGSDAVTGALVITERFVEIDGRQALQRILEFSGRPMRFRVDTIVDFWPAFEPHRLTAHGEFGMWDLRFVNRRVTGVLRDPAGVAEVDTSLTDPVISASSLIAFLRTLPPRPGLQFAVNAYSPREGVFEYRGTVQGLDTLTLRDGERRAALRIVASGAGSELTAWLDTSSGRLLRLHVPLNGEMMAWAH